MKLVANRLQWLAFVAMLLMLSLFSARLMPDASAATAQTGTIAYTTGASVRLVEPDGSNDRLLWASPHPVDNGINGLAWRHDGTELAFISNHEASVSPYEQDIYAIRPDGTGLRKLTNAPAHDALAGYPKGIVTVDVNVLSPGGGPYLVYVSGAPVGQTVSGAAPSTTRLTFTNVADFGATQQPVVAVWGDRRWFNAASADVQPGATVHAGTLTISGDGFWHFGVHADVLSWRSDDSRLGFIFGAGCEMRQTAANPPAGMKDSPLLSPAVSGTTCLLDWAPLSARAGEILYTESNPFTGVGHIYLTNEGSTGAGEPLINYPLPSAILDLEWLPDGSGFLFSYLDESYATANIYAYTWGASSVTPLTSFTDEYAGSFSISPDGQNVVFERAASLEDNPDLWVMAIDGSGLRLLVRDAGRPDWGSPSGGSEPPPPPVGDERVYVPFVVSR